MIGVMLPHVFGTLGKPVNSKAAPFTPFMYV